MRAEVLQIDEHPWISALNSSIGCYPYSGFMAPVPKVADGGCKPHPRICKAPIGVPPPRASKSKNLTDPRSEAGRAPGVRLEIAFGIRGLYTAASLVAARIVHNSVQRCTRICNIMEFLKLHFLTSALFSSNNNFIGSEVISYLGRNSQKGACKNIPKKKKRHDQINITIVLIAVEVIIILRLLVNAVESFFAFHHSEVAPR